MRGLKTLKIECGRERGGGSGIWEGVGRCVGLEMVSVGVRVEMGWKEALRKVKEVEILDRVGEDGIGVMTRIGERLVGAYIRTEWEINEISKRCRRLKKLVLGLKEGNKLENVVEMMTSFGKLREIEVEGRGRGGVVADGVLQELVKARVNVLKVRGVEVGLADLRDVLMKKEVEVVEIEGSGRGSWGDGIDLVKAVWMGKVREIKLKGIWGKGDEWRKVKEWCEWVQGRRPEVDMSEWIREMSE